MASHDLKYALRMAFGLGPFEPTDHDLANIAADLSYGATKAELDAAVQRHCDTYQTHAYAGANTIDLRDAINDLLDNYKK